MKNKQLFFENTSFHVLGDIFKSKTLPLKLFWSLIFSLAVTALAYQFYKQIDLYTKSDIKVSIHTKHTTNLPLPDVIVCYPGSMNQTKMKLAGIRNETLLTMKSSFYPVNDENLRARMRSLINDEMKRLHLNRFRQLVEKFAYEFDEFVELFGYANSNGIENNNVKFIHHTQFYNCYHLQLKNQTYQGLVGGVTLKLKTPIAKESLGFAMSFELEIFSGRPYRVINPYSVAVGFTTNIMLSKGIHKRLSKLSFPRSISFCEDTKTHPAKYQTSCAYDCWHNFTRKHCGCKMAVAHPHPEKDVSDCTPFEKNGGMCENDSSERMECQNSCQAECETTAFEAVLTSVPSYGYNEDSVAVVNIGYIELSTEEIVESEAYPLTDLISNIGGQMGLFLGCSLISMIQAVVLCTVGRGTEGHDSVIALPKD